MVLDCYCGPNFVLVGWLYLFFVFLLQQIDSDPCSVCTPHSCTIHGTTAQGAEHYNYS